MRIIHHSDAVYIRKFHGDVVRFLLSAGQLTVRSELNRPADLSFLNRLYGIDTGAFAFLRQRIPVQSEGFALDAVASGKSFYGTGGKVLSAVYIYDLIFAVFVLVPAFYYYFYFASFTAVGIIIAVICFFAAPLIPMSLGSLLSYFIGLLTRRLRRKNLFSILLSLVFLIAWMFISQNSASIIKYIYANGAQLKDAIAKYYLPSSWLLGAVNGSILEFLLFIAINLAVMFLVFAVISKKYAEIIAILNTSGVRKKARLDRLGSQNNSALGAMIQKELSMYSTRQSMCSTRSSALYCF